MSGLSRPSGSMRWLVACSVLLSPVLAFGADATLVQQIGEVSSEVVDAVGAEVGVVRFSPDIDARITPIILAPVLAAVKLVIMPLIVYGLCVASGLNPLYTIAAVVCAAVPTAKTLYILAGQYQVEEPLVAATVSITTLLSVVTLLGWLYALSGLAAHAG
jgi:predicted permease